MRKGLGAGFLGFVLCAVAHVATAKTDLPAADAAQCDHAASAAADRHGVPLDVLRAIALAETGHQSDTGFAPWPWALNPGGAGTWYPTRADALAAAQAHRATGRRNLDLGCFQINYHWHGDAFPSLEAMLDPATNADYAARFLSALFAEFGDWNRAAAAYHSRTPALAARYQARFERIRAALPAFAALPEPTAPPPPTLGAPWPLDATDGTRTAGSLVRIAGGGAGALWSDAPRAGILR